MFRMLVVGCVAAGIVMVGAGVALAGHSGKSGGPKDFAVGGGTSAFGTHLGISAHSESDGADPSGHVRTRSEFFTLETLGHVTCLRVSGNRATIGYEFDKSESGSTEGEGRLLFVEDNGNPRGGQPVDEIRGSDAFPAAPEDCPPPEDPGLPLRHGNLTVHDAP